MTKRPAVLLARPAPAAAALLGLARLDEARAACGRLSDPDDGEALHDFRVALRRLRTLLRSFRPELGDAVPKKLQRRLRDLTRATSAGRDAEVQLAWVRDHKSELGPRPRPGLPWFLARLEQRRDQAYAQVREEIPQEFRQLERRVRRALNGALADATPDGAPFAARSARLIREHVAALEQELGAAQSPRDEDAIHAARIAVKRLRYLLEPLADEAPQARAGVTRLKDLQDVLGELHDLQVLLAELGEAVAQAAAERARRLHQVALRGTAGRDGRRRAGPQPASAGLLVLAHRASRSQEDVFRRLETDWKTGPVGELTQDLGALADSLAATAIPPPRGPLPRGARRPRRATLTRAEPHRGR